MHAWPKVGKHGEVQIGVEVKDDAAHFIACRTRKRGQKTVNAQNQRDDDETFVKRDTNDTEPFHVQPADDDEAEKRNCPMRVFHTLF